IRATQGQRLCLEALRKTAQQQLHNSTTQRTQRTTERHRGSPVRVLPPARRLFAAPRLVLVLRISGHRRCPIEPTGVGSTLKNGSRHSPWNVGTRERLWHSVVLRGPL